jgi:DNA invertase Pin-like site-specific DNA recombinase
MVMQDTTKCVGYARISTNEQNSVNQIDVLKKEGVSVIFCDEGISGAKPAMSRADYRAMVKYLEEHKEVTTIVTYELSRFGRNLQDSINLFLDWEKQGYHIYSISEQWTHQSDPNMRSLMVLIVSWMNQQELIRDSQRIKVGMERAMMHGTKSGKPIGREPKKPDIKKITDMRNDGLSWHKIADTCGMEVSTLFRYRKSWKLESLGRGVSKSTNTPLKSK